MTSGDGQCDSSGIVRSNKTVYICDKSTTCFAYADDVAPVSPTVRQLKEMFVTILGQCRQIGLQKN